MLVSFILFYISYFLRQGSEILENDFFGALLPKLIITSQKYLF